MLSIRDTYTLGYLTSILGIHFNGLEILLQTQQSATGALKDRLNAVLESWPKKGPEAVQNVRWVESLMQREGFALDPPPRSAVEYEDWLKAIRNRFHAHLEGTPQDPPERKLAWFSLKWALSLGTWVGENQQNINLAAIVHYLLGALVPHPLLQAQLGQLHQVFQESLEQISMIAQRTEFLKVFSQEAHQTINTMVSLFKSADITGIGNHHDEHFTKLQEIMKQVSEQKLDLKLDASPVA